MVKELRETDKVDLVVALSHSGIDHNGQGEDAVLAGKVPGIDVIISGHTHETLAQPAQVGNTLIVTAGAYTAYLGELALTVTPSGTPGAPPVSVTVDSYTLLNIDDMITGDPTTQTAVDQYIAGVDTALAPSGPRLQGRGGDDGGRPAAARARGGAGRQPGDGRLPDDHRGGAADRAAGDRGRRERGPARADHRRQDGHDLVRRSVSRHAARHRPRSDPGLFAGDVLSERAGHPKRPGAGRRPRGGPERLLSAGLRDQGRVRHDEAAVRRASPAWRWSPPAERSRWT